MNLKLLYLLNMCFITIFNIFAITPDSLEPNFQLAGKNKSELQKVISHYSSNRADSLKRKAAIFLIGNMDEHMSYVSKSWDKFQVELDTLYTKVDRPIELVNGFNTLYDKYAIGLQDINYVCDLQTVSAQFLISNIDQAFQTWKLPYCNNLNFTDFCEYILPYRVGSEPISDWRTELKKQFIPNLYTRIKKQKDSISVRDICNGLKTYRYSTITPIPNEVPDYNVHTLSIMRLGTCNYFAIQAALTARCLGVPVAIDFTPQWATRYNGHVWNALITSGNKPLSFGIGDRIGLGRHIETIPDRIPAKIYRKTFAKQPTSLAFIHGNEEIPPAFLSPCFIDVTKDYYKTINVHIMPLSAPPAQNKFAYLSVFNNFDWIPVAWSKIESNNLFFQNINKGICCLPSYFYQDRAIPAAYPILLLEDGTIRTLKPDLTKLETITLKRKYQDRMYSKLGYAMLGGIFQVANDSNFRDSISIYKVSEKPGQYYQVVNISPTARYKYFRFLSPKKSYGEVSEIEVYEPGSKNKLTGKVIGNNNPKLNHDRSNAFDGDALTYFSTNEADSTWVGLAFDNPKNIGRIVYLPRNDDNCIANNQLYELFYWDNKWISLGKLTGSNETYRLVYNNVPTNALLLLRNLTRGKEERIFTYENGKQVWW